MIKKGTRWFRSRYSISGKCNFTKKGPGIVPSDILPQFGYSTYPFVKPSLREYVPGVTCFQDQISSDEVSVDGYKEYSEIAGAFWNHGVEELFRYGRTFKIPYVGTLVIYKSKRPIKMPEYLEESSSESRKRAFEKQMPELFSKSSYWLKPGFITNAKGYNSETGNWLFTIEKSTFLYWVKKLIRGKHSFDVFNTKEILFQ